MSGWSRQSSRPFPWASSGARGRPHSKILPRLILRALTALAAPLVVLAILSAIVTNDIHGRQGALMMLFYLINTVVAMLIGLTLTNVFQPGRARRWPNRERP